eukprot:5377019-Amphidinium_carterae.1
MKHGYARDYSCSLRIADCCALWLASRQSERTDINFSEFVPWTVYDHDDEENERHTQNICLRIQVAFCLDEQLAFFGTAEGHGLTLQSPRPSSTPMVLGSHTARNASAFAVRV